MEFHWGWLVIVVLPLESLDLADDSDWWLNTAEIASRNIMDSTNAAAERGIQMKRIWIIALYYLTSFHVHHRVSPNFVKLCQKKFEISITSSVLSNKNLVLVDTPKHRWCTLATHKFLVFFLVVSTSVETYSESGWIKVLNFSAGDVSRPHDFGTNNIRLCQMMMECDARYLVSMLKFCQEKFEWSFAIASHEIVSLLRAFWWSCIFEIWNRTAFRLDSKCSSSCKTRIEKLKTDSSCNFLDNILPIDVAVACEALSKHFVQHSRNMWLFGKRMNEQKRNKQKTSKKSVSEQQQQNVWISCWIKSNMAARRLLRWLAALWHTEVFVYFCSLFLFSRVHWIVGWCLMGKIHK